MSAGLVVVWAWAEDRRVWDGVPYAADLGARPGLRTERVAHACVWVSDGGVEDLARARRVADQENEASGYAPLERRRVYSDPASEPDPLGRARRDVLADTEGL